MASAVRLRSDAPQLIDGAGQLLGQSASCNELAAKVLILCHVAGLIEDAAASHAGSKHGMTASRAARCWPPQISQPLAVGF
mmetsp:Transcript_42060/g.116155  ORF Transcript_42060/g.116155 Transcript_42060/m.116155 type:complete len:81 (-) Transcript_42060:174-416(-)